MKLTPEQRQIAASLDAQVQKLLQEGKDDVTVFKDMADSMPGIKQLMDTSEQGELDELCRRFRHFYRYTQIVKTVVAGIQSGDIQVPK